MKILLSEEIDMKRKRQFMDVTNGGNWQFARVELTENVKKVREGVFVLNE